jgi:sugar fermentation stimulation protein A
LNSQNKKPEAFVLQWPELFTGTLLKRYKRFMADVQLADGRIVTAHCPNSGKMTECCLPGQPVYVSFQNDPGRKLKYTWEMIYMHGSLVGVNTQVPNRLIAGAIEAGLVPELCGYDTVSREVKVRNSRIDLLLTQKDVPPCFVEIKNCTLVQNRMAAFPDAVTLRGRKHLEQMQELVQSGNRCVMFYLIQRMDANLFRPADEVDPAYGKALRQAARNGVEVLAYDVFLTPLFIRLNRRIDVILDKT